MFDSLVLRRFVRPLIVALAVIAGFGSIANPASAKESAIYTGFFSSLAVGGYDPVAYFTKGQPVEGKKEFQTRWMDAEWRFASAENRDLFVAAPEKYAPAIRRLLRLGRGAGLYGVGRSAALEDRRRQAVPELRPGGPADAGKRTYPASSPAPTATGPLSWPSKGNAAMTDRKRRFLAGALSLYVAFVFIQSLFFKFTDSPETQYIFGTLDAWGASLGFAGLFAPERHLQPVRRRFGRTRGVASAAGGAPDRTGAPPGRRGLAGARRHQRRHLLPPVHAARRAGGQHRRQPGRRPAFRAGLRRLGRVGRNPDASPVHNPAVLPFGRPGASLKRS